MVVRLRWSVQGFVPFWEGEVSRSSKPDREVGAEDDGIGCGYEVEDQNGVGVVRESRVYANDSWNQDDGV